MARTENLLADLDGFPLRRLTLCGVPYDDLWHLKLTRGGNCSVEAPENPHGSPPSAAITVRARLCVEDITCPWTDGTSFATYMDGIGVTDGL